MSEVTIKEKEEWAYWNKLEVFKVHQGIDMVFGRLPDRDTTLKPIEDPIVKELVSKIQISDECISEILAICKPIDECFIKFSTSLRADKKEGNEWCKINNEQLAESYINKKLFLHHWQKCKLPISEKFVIAKKGRTAFVKDAAVLEFAQKCKFDEKEYEAFLKAAKREFTQYAEKTIRNKVTEKYYTSLKKSPK